MVANIRIEPDKVIRAGEEVKTVASSYNSEINNIYTIIDELNQYWQGSAAGRFVDDIEAYRNEFTSFGQKINEHGEILVEIGNDYVKIENGGI